MSRSSNLSQAHHKTTCFLGERATIIEKGFKLASAYATSQRRADDYFTANQWSFSKNISISCQPKHLMTSTTSQVASRPRSNNRDAQSGYTHKDASSSNPFSTPPLGGEKQKRLQTIESGIALNEAAKLSPESSNMIDIESTSPDSHHELLQWQVASSQSSSPVVYPSNTDSNFLPPLHHRINTGDHPQTPSLDHTTPKDIIDGKHHQTKHSYNPSSNSYYSADAGKHGFLSSTKSTGSGDSDDNGSLVFKYLPGEETPPAEYTLPASIMKVYGEEEDRVGVVDHVVLKKGASERSNCSSISSTGDDDSAIFRLAPDEDGEMPASAAVRNTAQNKKIDGNGKKNSQQMPPPLPLLAVGDNSSLSSPEMRMLPYQERKRLNEEKDADKAKNKMDLQVKAQQQLKKKNAGKKVEKQVMPSVIKVDKESSVLLPTRDINDSNSFDRYGAISTQNGSNNPKDDHNDHHQRPSRNGWFGNFVKIVAGKDEQATIEEESKSYRDQGRAFLEKTEQERMKLKEASKREEMNQLTIPYHLNGHSRSKMSSLTTALYSIASCSDDDEDISIDEESSSYEYDEDEESSGTPIATNTNSNRVWKYGDKSMTSSKARKISLRDERMKRERLIEEEYEYRLRALRHENQRLAMRFRLCVLISVTFIFAGALAFAAVVCVKMLFG